MKQRFSEEQIIAILHEAESAPTKAEVWRKHGISEWTDDRWREKDQGLNVSPLRKLTQLEEENGRLKKLVAEQAPAQETLKEVLAKKGIREGCGARSSRSGLGAGSPSAWPAASLGAPLHLSPSGAGGARGRGRPTCDDPRASPSEPALWLSAGPKGCPGVVAPTGGDDQPQAGLAHLAGGRAGPPAQAAAETPAGAARRTTHQGDPSRPRLGLRFRLRPNRTGPGTEDADRVRGARGAGIPAPRQRRRVHRGRGQGVAGAARHHDGPHRAGPPLGERGRRELPREAPGRMPESGGVLGRGARPGDRRAVAAPRQRGAAAPRIGVPDTGRGRAGLADEQRPDQRPGR